jgi:hypothetical protein
MATVGDRDAHRVKIAITAIALLSCSADESELEVDQKAVASAATDSVWRVAAAPWYSRARALDLTGDSRTDSARLEAVGSQPDSLRITLVLVVGGTVKHREQWGSSDELTLVDSAFTNGPQADSFLRLQLDSVLSSVRLQRFDAPGVRLMAEDSATLARLDPRPTHRVSFSYGYETTVRLAWDAPRQRFVRLWSCC